METIFIQLAIILVVAFVFSYISKILKQPIIIGYIFAGIVLSPFIIKFGASSSLITTFSKFGVAFLLFIVGLHLNPKMIKGVGVCAFFVGMAQMILTFMVGFLISLLLGLGLIPSAYVGIVLSFSSTIIVMKLLSDKKQLDSLYGKISAGILLVQDIAALVVLTIISTGIGNDGTGITNIGLGLIIIVLVSAVGFLVIPAVTKNFAKSTEILFLFSIAWCFVIIGAFNYFGFSIEMGALIAGIILSTSQYSLEISSKIRPLRDFFLVIFFIILGLSIKITNFNSVILYVLIFSAIAVFVKPIILMILMATFGYTKRTNFLIGNSLGQISEFSLIIAAMGLSLGHINQEIQSAIILTAIITIASSAYGITYSDWIYSKIKKGLNIFEKKNIKHERKNIQKKYDAILFGYNRIGFRILTSLQKIHQKYLVVDFDPDAINTLKKLNIPALYGDVYDPDLLEELPLEKIKLSVSTIPDFETNCLLIEEIRKANSEAIIISRAHQIEEALELYKKGADYVLTPHFLGGEYVSNLIAEEKTDKQAYKPEREKHIKMLKDFASKGHDHPMIEKD